MYINRIWAYPAHSLGVSCLFRSHLGQAEGPGEQNPGSGAYIFRPVSVHDVSESGSVLLQTIERKNGRIPQAASGLSRTLGCTQGPVVSEMRQSHSPWASVTHRLWKGQQHVEADWTVGPIPTEDGLGREASAPYACSVVSQWITDLNSTNVFYTDANGREMM
eukprot:scaffold95345_cov27-Prasinocladus_malaysianus.AAC.1